MTLTSICVHIKSREQKQIPDVKSFVVKLTLRLFITIVPYWFENTITQGHLSGANCRLKSNLFTVVISSAL